MTGLISLLSKGLSRVFFSTTIQSISSSVLSLLYSPTLTSVYEYWKNRSFDYMDLFQQDDVSAFQYIAYVCHSFPSKEQASFNSVAEPTVCSDSGAQENKICHCSTFSLPICQEAMEPDTMIFKPVFSSLSPSSRGSLVLHFLSLEWYHLYI